MKTTGLAVVLILSASVAVALLSTDIYLLVMPVKGNDLHGDIELPLPGFG